MVTPHLVRMPHPWHDSRAYWRCRGFAGDRAGRGAHAFEQGGDIGPGGGVAGEEAEAKRRTQTAGGPSVPLVVHTIHGLPFHPYQNALAPKAVDRAGALCAGCDAILCVADAMTRQARAAGVGRSPARISSPPSTAPWTPNPSSPRRHPRRNSGLLSTSLRPPMSTAPSPASTPQRPRRPPRPRRRPL